MAHGSISAEIVETAPENLDNPEIRNTDNVWLEAFHHAENTIDIEAPYFSDSLENMYVALQGAAKRGVKIRILTNYSSGLISLEGNENVTIHKPPKEELYIHAKYFIVDNRTAFVGSQNWSYPAVYSNHELGLLLKGEKIASSYTYIFESGWENTGGKMRGAKYWEGKWIYPVASGPAMSPEPTNTLNALLEIHKSAEKSINSFVYVMSTGAYPIARSLKSAAREGVKTRFMADAWYYPALWPEEQQNLSDWADNKFVGRLRSLEEEGVEVKTIYMGEWSRAHQKVTVVDNEMAYVGSANWTSSSMYERREVGVGIKESTLATALRKTFDTYWDSKCSRGPGEIPKASPKGPIVSKGTIFLIACLAVSAAIIGWTVRSVR